MNKQIKRTAIAIAIIGIGLSYGATAKADSDVANQKSSIYGQAISIEELVNTESYEKEIEKLLQENRRLKQENEQLRAAAEEKEVLEELSDAEWELLTKVVVAEAGYNSKPAQKNVAYVIFNRMNSTKFGDSVSEVVYSPGQFEVVSTGAYKSVSLKDNYIENVKEAYLDSQKEEVAQGALYFAKGQTAGATYLFTDDVGHVFCK